MNYEKMSDRELLAALAQNERERQAIHAAINARLSAGVRSDLAELPLHSPGAPPFTLTVNGSEPTTIIPTQPDQPR